MVVNLILLLKYRYCDGRLLTPDGGYRGEPIDHIRTKFGYVIQVVLSAYKEQGSRPVKRDGLWKGHSRGWIK